MTPTEFSTPSLDYSSEPSVLGPWFAELMRSVVISPTTEQIENATETVHYSASLDMADRCSISLENFTELEQVCRIKFCGHIFKPESIQEWFNTSVKCPVCRYDIRTYVQNAAASASTAASSNPYNDDVFPIV